MQGEQGEQGRKETAVYQTLFNDKISINSSSPASPVLSLNKYQAQILARLDELSAIASRGRVRHHLQQVQAPSLSKIFPL